MKCKFHSCDEEVRDNPYRGHTPLFCSKKCKNKDAVNTLRRKRKIQAIEYLGGICKECGYDGHPASYDFHHREPEHKDFVISKVYWNWENIKAELDKCDLLCANCHRTKHAIL